MSDAAQTPQTRCGFVAVIGAPNAGKSTFVNALVGSKVSIVSPKVQTTRMPVRGVAMRGQAQIIFVDTPGIFQPRRRLDRAMVKSAWAGAGDADAVLLIVDAADLVAKPKGAAARDTDAIVESLKKAEHGKLPKISLVLNKIDELPRAELLPLVQSFSETGVFDQVFMISALKSDGIDEVADWSAAHLPISAWLYPEDQAADIPSRLLASEITREKLYFRLHDELPYATTVETEAWTAKKDGSVKIDQIIYVERAGQKGIVLGKGGQTVKAIGESARREMETIFGHRVHLFLFVKVREGWAENREHYRDIGLEYPEE
ncbi:MAG TPA: GTPase Era [Rhizomicrobium sp.]|nr:GTPase Era [Rhizomicrobium sp.]